MQESLASLFEKHLVDAPAKDLWTRVLSSHLKAETLQSSSIQELLLDALQNTIQSLEDQQKACFKVFQIVLLVFPDRQKYKDHIKNAIRNIMSSGSFINDPMTNALLSALGVFLDLELEYKALKEEKERVPHLTKDCYILIFQMILGAFKKDQKALQQTYQLLNRQDLFLDHEHRPWTSLWQTDRQYSRKKTILGFYLLYFCGALLFDDSGFKQRRDRIYAIVEKEGMIGSASLAALMTSWMEKFLPVDSSLFQNKQELTPKILDEKLGLVGFRGEDHSVVYTLCGKNTSLGAMNYGRIRVVAFGPQAFPLSDASSFGIQRHFSEATKILQDENYTVGAESCSIQGWTALQDSAQWIQMTAKSQQNRSSLEFYLRGVGEKDIALVFYVRAGCCEISPNTVIYPQSLDHFKGALKVLSFSDAKRKVTFRSAFEENIQIIPLVGEGYFWDADFLLAYAFRKGQEKMKIDVQCLESELR